MSDEWFTDDKDLNVALRTYGSLFGGEKPKQIRLFLVGFKKIYDLKKKSYLRIVANVDSLMQTAQSLTIERQILIKIEENVSEMITQNLIGDIENLQSCFKDIKGDDGKALVLGNYLGIILPFIEYQILDPIICGSITDRDRERIVEKFKQIGNTVQEIYGAQLSNKFIINRYKKYMARASIPKQRLILASIIEPYLQ